MSDGLLARVRYAINHGNSDRLYRELMAEVERLTPRLITTGDQLEALPQFSVVRFLGAGLGTNTRLVWQLDEAWFAAGSPDYMGSGEFPPDAFPAVVIWNPALETSDDLGKA